jgi:hypothetical protein
MARKFNIDAATAAYQYAQGVLQDAANVRVFFQTHAHDREGFVAACLAEKKVAELSGRIRAKWEAFKKSCEKIKVEGIE